MRPHCPVGRGCHGTLATVVPTTITNRCLSQIVPFLQGRLHEKIAFRTRHNTHLRKWASLKNMSKYVSSYINSFCDAPSNFLSDARNQNTEQRRKTLESQKHKTNSPCSIDRDRHLLRYYYVLLWCHYFFPLCLLGETQWYMYSKKVCECMWAQSK